MNYSDFGSVSSVIGRWFIHESEGLSYTLAGIPVWVYSVSSTFTFEGCSCLAFFSISNQLRAAINNSSAGNKSTGIVEQFPMNRQSLRCSQTIIMVLIRRPGLATTTNRKKNYYIIHMNVKTETLENACRGF